MDTFGRASFSLPPFLTKMIRVPCWLLGGRCSLWRLSKVGLARTQPDTAHLALRSTNYGDCTQVCAFFWWERTAWGVGRDRDHRHRMNFSYFRVERNRGLVFSQQQGS